MRFQKAFEKLKSRYSKQKQDELDKLERKSRKLQEKTDQIKKELRKNKDKDTLYLF